MTGDLMMLAAGLYVAAGAALFIDTISSREAAERGFPQRMRRLSWWCQGLCVAIVVLSAPVALLVATVSHWLRRV